MKDLPHKQSNSNKFLSSEQEKFKDRNKKQSLRPAVKMSNVTDTVPSITYRLESFLYTPYGVATLAAIAILLTSLVWTVCCCIYCCCRRRDRNHEEGGTTEANRDLLYLGISTTDQTNNGTLSSGYNTGPQPYTTNSLTTGGTGMFNTSLDSILHEEA